MPDSKLGALTLIDAVQLTDEFYIHDVSEPDATGMKRATAQQVADALGVYKKALGSDFVISNVTMGKVTGLDYTLQPGLYWFEYRVVWQTVVAGTAIKLGVNFSGTNNLYVVEATGFEGTTAASTGALDQSHSAFGLRAGGSERIPSATISIFSPTAADLLNSNMLTIIKGVINVTVAGDLQLYFGSEATGSNQTCKAGTALRLTKF